ncbi:hypothetical protein BsWGS_27209 [Bradybaena similaris]
MYKYAVLVICAVLVAANICAALSAKEQGTGLESSRANEPVQLSPLSGKRIKREEKLQTFWSSPDSTDEDENEGSETEETVPNEGDDDGYLRSSGIADW